jgi:tRNA pseudouridine13 synthase
MSDSSLLYGNLPYLTGDLPGIGGEIKRFNEDFVVEELPLYDAGGEGDHTYFLVEKTGRTTHNAIELVAKALGKRRNDIGFAGLKDAHGVTRQMFSVEHVDPKRVESLKIMGIRILSVNRHTNKLKLGHLAGNRFTLFIRRVSASDLAPAKLILDRLVACGVPNYFGPQRFGVRGDNAEVGRAVLLDDFDEAVALLLGRPGPMDHGDVRVARELFEAGDIRGAALAWPPAFSAQRRVCYALLRAGGEPRLAWRAVDHSLRKLYTSAFQSALFNRVLADRIERIGRMEVGDLAWKHRNGACFSVEDAAAEQPRADALEISPTGPIFGPRMTEPSGAPGRAEIQVFADSGLSRDQMRASYLTKITGGRRPLRVPFTQTNKADQPSVGAGADSRGPYLKLKFVLPPGAYATGVTREICKSDGVIE